MEREESGERRGELELPGACVACGGDLVVKVGEEGTRGVCRGCRAWSRPRVSAVQGGVQVQFFAAGAA